MSERHKEIDALVRIMRKKTRPTKEDAAFVRNLNHPPGELAPMPHVIGSQELGKILDELDEECRQWELEKHEPLTDAEADQFIREFNARAEARRKRSGS